MHISAIQDVIITVLIRIFRKSVVTLGRKNYLSGFYFDGAGKRIPGRSN
jgi:hypothetical protein